MNGIKWFCVVFLGLIFLSFAYAVDPYNLEISNVEVRSDYEHSYSPSVDAEVDNYVDVRADIYLEYGDYYDSVPEDVYELVDAYVEVYGFDGYHWVFVKDSPIESEYIYIYESAEFEWNNVFRVKEGFEEYYVKVVASWSDEWTESEQAYVIVLNGGMGDCSDIVIYPRTIYLDEDTVDNVTFSVENHSESRFYIDEFEADDVSYYSFMDIEAYDYDYSIPGNGSASLEVRISTEEVSNDRQGQGYLDLRGHFQNGKECDFSEITTKYFNVQVRDTEPETSCSDVEVNANDVYMDEGKTAYYNFSIENNGERGFWIDSVDAVELDSEIDVEETYYDHYISPDSSGTYRVKVETEEVSNDRVFRAKVRVEGHFTDGSDCTYTEYFDVHVNDLGEESECDEIDVRVNSVYLHESSSKTVKFTVYNNSLERFYLEGVSPKETSSSFNMSVEDKSTYINSRGNGFIELNVKSYSVSEDVRARASVNLRGHFSGGKECDYSDIVSDYFYVNIEDTEEEAMCKDIEINTESITLEEGTTEYKTFELENNTRQTFYIDDVEAYDNDADFDVEEYKWDKTAYSNGTADLEVKVKAFGTDEDESGTGYIKVKGHFSGGESCSFSQIGTESFMVYVEGEESTCSNFELSVPSEKTVKEKTVISFTVDNPFNRKAEIRLSGKYLEVSPGVIEIPADYFGTKTVEVTLKENKETYLLYDVELSGCNVPSKTTKIIPRDEEKEIEIVNYPSKKRIEGESELVFEVRNNSSDTQNVRVYLDGFPSGWEVQEKSVSIEGKETEKVYLSVTPEGKGEFRGSVIAETDEAKDEKRMTLVVGKEVAPSIEVEVIKPEIGNTYEVIVSITNDSDETIEGEISLSGIPEGWEVEGEDRIEVEAGREEMISLKVTPDKDVTEEQGGTIEFNVDGKSYSEPVSFKPVSPLIPTAFLFLGQGMIAFVLLVIVVAILFFIIRRK